jgi:hypothetical protein
VAVGVLALLLGVILSNHKMITLKPELSMDGIATIVAGLALVIALNVAFTNYYERRHSAFELLSTDVREVVKAAQAAHDYIEAIQGSGGQVQLPDEGRQKLQRLIQEYSNSLILVEHTLRLCNFDANAELDTCKHDRERYKDLITGGTYPVIDGTVFRAESGEHTTIQKNLRTLLFKIGRI